MAGEINVEIVEDSIDVEVTGTSTWDSLAGKPTPVAQNSFIVSDAALDWVVKTLAQVRVILGLGTAAYQNIAYFALASHNQSASTITPLSLQTAVFANPLNIDTVTYKDWKCILTGDTIIDLINAVDGDAGMLIFPIAGADGYTVTFNAATFTKKIGTTSLDLTAGKENIVTWRKLGAEIYYIINSVM
jgi:hypothetical protein